MKLKKSVKLFLIFLAFISLTLFHHYIPSLPENLSWGAIKSRLFSKNDIYKKLTGLFQNSSQKTIKATKIETQVLTEKTLALPPPLQKQILLFDPYQEPLDPLTLSSTNHSNALAPFYEQMLKTVLFSQKNRVTLSVFGDSLISGDMIVSTWRSLFEKHFESAGPGYVCVRRPVGGYDHSLIMQRGSMWKTSSYQQKEPLNDLLGLNGYAFRGKPGDWAEFTFPQSVNFDTIKLHYFARPGGGTFKIGYGDGAQKISTHRLSENRSAFTTIENIPPKSGVTLKVLNNEALLYGIEFSKKVGLLLNAFPMIGADIEKLLAIRESLFTDQLAEIKSDLTILIFWGNRAAYTILEEEEFALAWGSTIDRVIKATPGKSLLVIGPMGVPRERKGMLEVKPIILHMNRVLHDLCLEKGVAYLDLYVLTGRKNSIENWYGSDKYLINPDLIHFTKTGSELIANQIFEIIMSGFRLHLQENGYL